MDEQMSTVEYSMMVADKAEDSDSQEDASQSEYVQTVQAENTDDPQPDA